MGYVCLISPCTPPHASSPFPPPGNPNILSPLHASFSPQSFTNLLFNCISTSDRFIIELLHLYPTFLYNEDQSNLYYSTLFFFICTATQWSILVIFSLGFQISIDCLRMAHMFLILTLLLSVFKNPFGKTLPIDQMLSLPFS